MELHCDDNDTEIHVGENALHQKIDELRMTWAAMQIGQKQLLEKMPLTDAEVNMKLYNIAEQDNYKGSIIATILVKIFSKIKLHQFRVYWINDVTVLLLLQNPSFKDYS